jgi:hypothetical protein
VQLLVKIAFIDLEAGDIQRLSECEVPSSRAFCAAARSPSTQSASSARSALCLAPTPQGYYAAKWDRRVWPVVPVVRAAEYRGLPSGDAMKIIGRFALAAVAAAGLVFATRSGGSGGFP